MDFPESHTVVTLLANRMVPPELFNGRDAQVKRSGPEGLAKRKLVFLLGAGCSRQYGLPSFIELLEYLWEDCFREPDPPSRLEVLRDQLDKFWQAQGPEDRERMLDYYLSDRVSGGTCSAYLHLAQLAEKGYVKAIVNMNFDTLLEEALDAANVSYRVATSFLVQDDRRVIVYKPHGTIGPVDSQDVIHGLQRAVQKILEAEQPFDESKKILSRNFRRAKEVFEEDKALLLEVPQNKVEISEALIRLCFLVLGSGALPKDEACLPDLTLLRQVLESLDHRDTSPVRVKNDLILDIANSDLFSDPNEQSRAQELLTRHDVVSIGYSGVDAKIAAALRAFPPGADPKDKKLFVVNLSRPDPRLLLVMAERSSQDLLISGQDAAFENFMGDLVGVVQKYESGRPLRRKDDEEQDPPPLPPSSMTRAEQRALNACLRMAQEIRLSMNVAERSSTSIEKHGYKIFGDCLALGRHAGICLSSAEKYLLHCAAFLHDLGYYRGYTRAKASENPGWTLLRRHGILTKELLEERFKGDRTTLASIIPKTYLAKEVSFEDLLCTLCEGHTGLVEMQMKIGNTHIGVGGVQVPVRFPLLLSLFALAEDLSEGHPFVPSPDFIGPSSRESTLAIVDPVLDLYLRHSERPVEFFPERGRIVVKERDEKGRRDTMRWLLTMAAHHVRRFDEAARAAGGWGIKLDRLVPDLPPLGDPTLIDRFEDLLRFALLEMLGKHLLEIQPGSPGEATALLDLVSIYTMSTAGGAVEEPRVPLDKPLLRTPGDGTPMSNSLDWALRRAQAVLWEEQLVPQQGLLQHYLPRYHQGLALDSPMERLFLESFQRIVYPAWRFFARNWHDGIEALLMARACFDLGSSQLRGETLGGVKRLLDEKVEWNESGDMAYGHDRCTLCTSRLLYVLTNARRLVASADFAILDRTIRGILNYMLSLDPRGEIWWGLGAFAPSRSTIHSADYLAWAARSVGFALSVDVELSKRGSQENWLSGTCELDRGALNTLLRQRWDQLFAATEADLLNPLAEEPHSFIFGHVALACLDLKRWQPEIRSIASDDVNAQVLELARTLRAEADQIGIVSQLSKFNLWPLELLLDSTEPGSNAAAENAARVCYNCVQSPVWIKWGGDAGSWGFNVKNTQSIVTSLVEFWRYVFQDETQEKRFDEIFRGLDPEFGKLSEVSS